MMQPSVRRASRWPLTILVALSGLALVLPAAAQTDTLTLYVRRSFGYSSGSQIQGSFRLEVDGPPTLTQVTYGLDEAVIGTVTEAPFRLNFNTDVYPKGWHTFTAVGRTRDGQTLTATSRRFEFVSAEEGLAVGLRIGGIVLAVVALSFGLTLLPVLLGRRQPVPLGAPRQYGWLGGAICPHCGRPYPRHLFALNVGLQKLDRCDHCGKWRRVGRASPEALRAAEAAELQAAAPTAAPPSSEEKARKALDDSRYID